MALNADHDGVYVIASNSTPIFGGSNIALDRLLSATELGAELRSLPGIGPVEVLATKGLSDDSLRSLNHRRDQIKAGRSVLLVFDPSDCTRLSRIADDLWKWATVIELDQPLKTWEYTAATGSVEMDRYAPALQPGEVIGPAEKLTAAPELDR